MLGRVDPQGSLLETRHMRRHLVTKGSFYERLADHGHELISGEHFAHLCAQGKGRPSVPPSVLVWAMLCATHDRTSDAETSRRTRVDSDWKAAMGVDDWFEGIGATTFSLMRARMVGHDADGALFQKTLERAVGAGIFKQPLSAVIDSSPVHGAGAVASTYELVRKMMGRLARALASHLDAALAAKVAALAAAKPGIDWQGPVARKEHLGELLELAATLLGSAAADPGLAADPDSHNSSQAFDPHGERRLRQFRHARPESSSGFSWWPSLCADDLLGSGAQLAHPGSDEALQNLGASGPTFPPRFWLCL